MNTDAVLASSQGNPIVLEGDNFSGRTDLLHRCVADRSQQGDQAIHLGSCVHRYLSSLPSVHDELYIHALGAAMRNHCSVLPNLSD